MDTLCTRETIRAVMASQGATQSVADIRLVLSEMMEILGPGDEQGWGVVFETLGQQHPGVQRFNILEALIELLVSFSDSLPWMSIWLKTISRARIHPISLPLLGPSRLWDFWELLRQTYTQLYPGKEGHPILRTTYSMGRYGNRFTLMISLSPGAKPEDILCLTPLQVHEQQWASVTTLGTGWCVRELRIGEMPGLRELGSDLTVMRDLDLVLAPRVRKIGPRSRVGGITFVFTAKHPGWSTFRNALPKGAWASGVGVRRANQDWVSDGRSFKVSGERLPHPIEFPDSSFRLHLGMVRW